ncbi:MAG TPA: hypothetical protein VEZ70_04905 [Allosphingosinicella sp.]|nr:hypothetical protein [Allosphingosinicella sp.]
MGKKMRRLVGLAIIFGAALPAVSASAQTTVMPPAIVPTLDKPCRPDAEEIIVCGRREEQRSPFRLAEPPPRFDPGGSDYSVSRERHSLYEHGDTGIHSCSTVGPGGYTGCAFRKWKDGDEQWGGQKRGSRKRPGEY